MNLPEQKPPETVKFTNEGNNETSNVAVCVDTRSDLTPM